MSVNHRKLIAIRLRKIYGNDYWSDIAKLGKGKRKLGWSPESKDAVRKKKEESK